MLKKILYTIVTIIIFFISVFFVYNAIQEEPEKLINYQATSNSLNNQKGSIFTKIPKNLSLKEKKFIYQPFQNPNLKFYDQNHREIGKRKKFESPQKRYLFLNLQKSVYDDKLNMLSSREFNEDNTIKYNDKLTFNITYDNDNRPLTTRYFNADGTVDWQNQQTLDTIYNANTKLLNSRHFIADKQVDWIHQNTYDVVYDDIGGRITYKRRFNLDGTTNWLDPDTFDRTFNDQGFRIKERHFNADGTINWTQENTLDIQRNSKNEFIKTIYFDLNGKPLK